MTATRHPDDIGRMSAGSHRVPEDERHPADPTQPVDADTSFGELLGRVSHDFSELVSTQVELAKVEIKEEVATAGRGAGMLGAAAFCAYMAVVLVSFALAWALGELIPEGLAFLVVGLLYVIAAAVLFPKGRKKLNEASRGPERTAESFKEDVRWAREQMH